MSAPVALLGFAGSLRQDSWNHRVLEACRPLVPEGATLDTFRITDIPPFNQDIENPPPEPVQALHERVRAADALLILTPEYNYGLPGVLKNVLDWGSRPPGTNVWANKPVAIAGATPGRWGTVRAQMQLRQVLWALDMHVLKRPEVLIPEVPGKFDEAGYLTDERTIGTLTKMLAALVEWTQLVKSQ